MPYATQKASMCLAHSDQALSEASRSAGSLCHRASGDVSVSCPVQTKRFRLDGRKTAAGDGTGHCGPEFPRLSAVEHAFLSYETLCRRRQGRGALNANRKRSQVAWRWPSGNMTTSRTTIPERTHLTTYASVLSDLPRQWVYRGLGARELSDVTAYRQGLHL